jgi:hypothetical protein
MDENIIRGIIKQLDDEVPRERAKVILEQYGGGPDESQIVANQTGYLRLGIEFLKAGFAERKPISKKGYEEIPVDLDYLISENSTVGFDNFEITESFTATTYKRKFYERLIPIGCITIIGILALLALIGFGVVVNNLFYK